MADGSGFVRIAGDGLVVEGPCIVTDLLLYTKSNNDQCIVYDGLDVTSGKLFLQFVGNDKETKHLHFGAGIQFNNGVFVDQSDTDDTVTVCFRQ